MKNKRFLGAFGGAKSLDGPLTVLWGDHGRVPPPPWIRQCPNPASHYRAVQQSRAVLAELQRRM